MKTQVIKLEVHDDLISARDKMGWSKAGRILLGWPESGAILNRRLDVLLLLRHSRALGAQLAFVADDPELRYQARSLGVMVFSNVQQALKANWRERRRRPASLKRPPSPRHRPPDLAAMRAAARPAALPTGRVALFTRLGFFLLAIAAIGSLAAVLIPGAELHLRQQTRQQEIAFTVRADAGSQAINLSGIVPARLATVTVSGETSAASRGTVLLPVRTARVDLLLTNLTDQAISVPAGTVARSAGNDPVRFATEHATFLPAGVGASISVSARAMLPGEAGNIAAEQLTILEGPLGAQVTVTNPLPATGGENRPVPAPTEAQRQEIYAQLVEQLKAQALDELAVQIPPGDILITPTITLTQVIDQRFDPPNLQPADVLTLYLSGEFSAQVVAGQDLRSLAAAVLDANLPPEAAPVADTLAIEHLSAPLIAADGLPAWRIRATRQYYDRLATDAIAQSVRGLPPAQAAERLRQSLLLAEAPVIRIFPSWWPRLPLLPLRIAVQSQPAPR